MERAVNVVRVVWVRTIYAVLALLALEFLAIWVAWVWPCDWPWQQTVGGFNPHCPRMD
jgi:hypothetical protein